MAMLAWPSISETILGLTFFSSSSVAQVCRRSWKRIFDTPTQSRSFRQWRVMRWRSKGSPISEVTITRSPASGAQPLYLPPLALQMASEPNCGALGELHGSAATSGLRRCQNRASFGPNERAPHLQHSRFQIYVVPLEGQQLTLLQSGVYSQHVERFEAVPLCRTKKHLDLFRRQGTNLL